MIDLVHVKRMSFKGHEESEMTKEQLLELVCKIGKSKYYLVDDATREVIRDIKSINETQSILIVPVVAGGSE